MDWSGNVKNVSEFPKEVGIDLKSVYETPARSKQRNRWNYKKSATYRKTMGGASSFSAASFKSTSLKSLYVGSSKSTTLKSLHAGSSSGGAGSGTWASLKESWKGIIETCSKVDEMTTRDDIF
eukprot:11107335-Ditylum_brightwellii.AAC.1